MKLIRQPILPPLWWPILLCSLVMLPFGCGAAGHPPLLPRPRDARYGEGSLAVSGLAIRFACSAERGGTFAAQQLAAGLSAAMRRGTIEPAKSGTGNFEPGRAGGERAGRQRHRRT